MVDTFLCTIFRYALRGSIPVLALHSNESRQIVLAVLFAVAAITCVGRISLRFSSLRRLDLDDAILLASFLCLIISTSLAYTYMYPWYLAFAW